MRCRSVNTGWRSGGFDPGFGPGDAGGAAFGGAAHFRGYYAGEGAVVDGDLGAAGGEEAAIDAVGAARGAAGGVVEHIGGDEVVPVQDDGFGGGDDGFVPEGGDGADFGEAGGDYRQVGVGEFGEQHSFDFGLEVAGEGDVVGVDADGGGIGVGVGIGAGAGVGIGAGIGAVGFQEEGVAGAGGGPEDAPVAGAGGLRGAGLGGEADEGVFAGEANLAGVNGGGGHRGSILRCGGYHGGRWSGAQGGDVVARDAAVVGD